MGNVTIGTLTLQGDDKSFVGEISSRKESVLTPMPFYTLDSDQTDVFDFGGVVKTINVSGVFIGTSNSDCITFKNAFEGLQQGHQDNISGYPITFVQDIIETIYVKIMDSEWTNVGGEPFIIRWNLKLVESSQNS